MTDQPSEITPERIRRALEDLSRGYYRLLFPAARGGDIYAGALDTEVSVGSVMTAYLAKCEEVAEYQSFVKILADFLDYPSMTKWTSDNATEGETILVGQIGAAAALLGGCKMFNPFEEDNQRLQAIIEKQREAIEEIINLDIKGHSLLDRLQFSEEGRPLSLKIQEVLAITPTKTEES